MKAALQGPSVRGSRSSYALLPAAVMHVLLVGVKGLGFSNHAGRRETGMLKRTN
jgi:hypothetical protein